MKTVITTTPFGVISSLPIELLEGKNVPYRINPLGRKLRPEEVAEMIGDAEIVIAGTEAITKDVIQQCPNLKAICRVGIGLDSVDLVAAKERNIQVSYTPDGPSPAVAELTIGLMLDLLRRTSQSDREIRSGVWFRKAGRRLSECKVGIIGCGRIGSRVINHLLNGFPGVQVYANDLTPKTDINTLVNWVDKETIYEECDIISLHLPLTPETQNLITSDELKRFKKTSLLINTSRGGIVNEIDLAQALRNGVFDGAGIDVFEEEPYRGDLCEFDNVILSCHLGSMTEDCRSRMEIEAIQEAIRFIEGNEFLSCVPESEYDLAERFKK